MKGKLIVLEGIDGCGKSTQMQYLADWLPNCGLIPKDKKIILTREPGGTSLGIELRKMLLHESESKSPSNQTELLLYAADRAQHISELIMPNLSKGNWVISDRFSGSTLAYQGFGRKLSINVIKQLEIIALQGVMPDLTIWLDLPVRESLIRRQKKPNDRIENEGEEFLKRVALGFKVIAKEGQWVRIDAMAEMHLIHQQISEIIKKKFIQNKIFV